MEPIEVVVDDILYTALPMPDGSFHIFEGGNSLGTIKPGVNDSLSVRWVTADLFSAKLAQKIGDAIERKEL